jgi:hypothetical protein
MDCPDRLEHQFITRNVADSSRKNRNQYVEHCEPNSRELYRNSYGVQRNDYSLCKFDSPRNRLDHDAQPTIAHSRTRFFWVIYDYP